MIATKDLKLSQIQNFALGLALAATVVARSPQAFSNPEIQANCGKASKTAGQQGEIKAQNCKAAEDAQTAADKNSALYKVWGSVAVVCTSSCASSVAGASPTTSYCTGSSLAAGGVDATYSRDFMAAMAPAQGALMSKATSSGGQQAAQQGAGQGQQQAASKDLGSCMTAASASQSSMNKYKSMKSSENTVANSLKSVKDMKSKDDVPVVNGNGGPQAEMAAAEAGDQGAGSFADGSMEGGAGDSDPCSRARSTKGFSDTLQCASMSDPGVPSFVAQPQFQKDFQKIAGMSMPDFIASDESPSRVIARAAAGGSGDAGSGARLASLLESGTGGAGGPANSNYELASAYSGGGSGSESSGSSDDAMGQMLAGLLQQMMPQDEDEAKRQASLKQVILANNEAHQRRSPASLSENTSLNLFDRVTYRYYYVSARVLNGGDAR